jgi:hypothetical protein
VSQVRRATTAKVIAHTPVTSRPSARTYRHDRAGGRADVLAFHDFDAAVAGGEGVTVFGDPGRGDEYALGGVLVFHDVG